MNGGRTKWKAAAKQLQFTSNRGFSSYAFCKFQCKNKDTMQWIYADHDMWYVCENNSKLKWLI